MFTVATNDSTNIEKYIDPITGFLHVKGVIARSGIQEYYGLQLPFEGLNPMEKYAVMREPSEVSDANSIASFRNAPVTDEHPSELVTTDNYKNYQKGTVSVINIIEDEETLLETDMTIYDSGLIEKVNNGTVKMSAGYLCDYLEEAGEYKGVPFRFKQKNIRGNHVAMTDSPRCGDTCKMAIDSGVTIIDEIQGVNMATIMIGETEYEVPEEVAAEFARLSEEKPAIEVEGSDEVEAVKAENEMLKEKMSSDSLAIEKQIEQRATVLATATTMGIAVSVSDSETNMKRTILKAKRGVCMADKADAYVDVAFDMLVADMKAAEDSQRKIADEAKIVVSDAWSELKDKEY
jgi:hypothetical protein